MVEIKRGPIRFWVKKTSRPSSQIRENLERPHRQTSQPKRHRFGYRTPICPAVAKFVRIWSVRTASRSIPSVTVLATGRPSAPL